jgi:hypothetical protein
MEIATTYQLNLTEEGIDLLPARKDALFFLWEVHGYCVVVCLLRQRGGVMIFWSWLTLSVVGQFPSTALSIVHLDLTHPGSAYSRALPLYRPPVLHACILYCCITRPDAANNRPTCIHTDQYVSAMLRNTQYTTDISL